MNEQIAVLELEIFDDWGGDKWAEAKYLVTGWNDSLWTNSLDEALKFLKREALAVEADHE